MVYAGMTVALECESDISVEWFYNKNESLPRNAHSYIGTTLDIYNVNAKNNGLYYCFGQEDTTYFVSQIELKVHGMLGSYTMVSPASLIQF